MKCDELKSFNCVDSDFQEFCGPRLVYLKSEADKVIAEKDAEIARLKAIRKVHVEAIESMEAGLLQDEEENRHSKYKRCLDKAELCRLEQERIELIENQDITDDDFNKLVKGFYKKWRKRWLELAEKFKPNSTAQ